MTRSSTWHYRALVWGCGSWYLDDGIKSLVCVWEVVGWWKLWGSIEKKIPAFFFVGFERGPILAGCWKIKCVFSQKNHQTCGYFTYYSSTNRQTRWVQKDGRGSEVSKQMPRPCKWTSQLGHSLHSVHIFGLFTWAFFGVLEIRGTALDTFDVSMGHRCMSNLTAHDFFSVNL